MATAHEYPLPATERRPGRDADVVRTMDGLDERPLRQRDVRRSATRPWAVLLGGAIGTAFVLALILIGRAAAAPHSSAGESAIAGHPPMGGLVGVAAVLVAAAIVVPAVVLALRAVLARPLPPLDSSPHDVGFRETTDRDALHQTTAFRDDAPQDRPDGV